MGDGKFWERLGLIAIEGKKRRTTSFRREEDGVVLVRWDASPLPLDGGPVVGNWEINSELFQTLRIERAFIRLMLLQ